VVTTRINEAENDGMAAGGFSNTFVGKYIDSLPEVKALTFFTSDRVDLVAGDLFF